MPCRSSRLLLLVLALLLGWGPAMAAEAAPCGPFRVGAKLYPLVYERVPGSSTEFRGLDKDFFALLAERSGCRFVFELESQPRIWARLRNGSLDITNWVLATPERQGWVEMLPLVRVNPVAVTWTAQGVKTPADLLARPELLAVAVRDASYGPGYDALLQRLRAQGRVADAGDIEVAARVFFARRLGLLVTYPWVVAGPMRELPAGELQLVDWFPDSRGLDSALALSRSTISEADRRRILEALQSLQRDGSLARLMRQHVPIPGLQVLERIAPR